VRDAWIAKDELAARPEDDDRPLVCSLRTAAFEGAETTRYARRGHIPGSVSLPADSLFGEDGKLRKGGDLAAVVRAALPGIAPGSGSTEVLLYCGGGISAAADALALAQLGIRAVRIYDGSLEEWSADDGLPLESGPASPAGAAPASAGQDAGTPESSEAPAGPGGAGSQGDGATPEHSAKASRKSRQPQPSLWSSSSSMP